MSEVLGPLPDLSAKGPHNSLWRGKLRSTEAGAPKGHLNSNWNPGLSPRSPPLRETELGRDLAKKQPLCSVPDPGGGGILSLAQEAQAAGGQSLEELPGNA